MSLYLGVGIGASVFVGVVLYKIFGRRMSIPFDKKIVIIGAGYGGCEVGFNLLKIGANFVIIDSRDAMHNNMAAARAASCSGFAPKTVIPYKPTFGDKFKQGEVVKIDTEGQNVILSTGEEIPYDILVISTGTSGSFPSKHNFEVSSDAVNHYEDIALKIKDSDTITVIGGGAAGVEIVGEIITQFPQKNINLIHTGNALCKYPNLTGNFQQKILEWLKSWNVNVLLNTKVSNMHEINNCEAGVIITDSGEKIQSDLILVAIGMKVNSAPYKEVLADKMESNGALIVNEHLLVQGCENIFAVGDCNNVPETKLAFGAQAQAKVVFNNICKSSENSFLDVYHAGGSPIGMLLALGQGIGMGQLKNGWMLPNFLAGKLKAGDVCTSMTWKSFNQIPPK